MNRAGVGSSKSLILSLKSVLQLDCYNEKDVYSFGLVLLELITGRTWHNADLEDKELPNGLLRQGLDETIVQFYGVAKDCVNPKTKQRPSMLQVCKRLQEIKLDFENAGDSEISILTY
ncbi:receptor-like serine/threonine-protein kinase At1g78530 [Henckelia pumila]|uniref:receptor-like serine/threonine-protein kinase At1g78530 n=1 Tax=Henckelia pumila TaxID=405737 RepID=UPI003C6DD8D6